jgi:[ribosomal protein S5]-alanine N-acetyltransferase
MKGNRVSTGIQIDMGEFCIRHFSPDDVAGIVYHADNPKVARYLRNQFPHPYTTEDAKTWILHALGQTPVRDFALAGGAGVIGGIGLVFQDDVYFQSAELGYWLGEPYWGRGIMTRAVGAFTRYAFDAYDLVRLFAHVFESNPASARVLEKAGYRLEGVLEKNVNKNGRILNEWLYACIKV